MGRIAPCKWNACGNVFRLNLSPGDRKLEAPEGLQKQKKR